ncbi:MAG: DUF1573 domain-containing protein [Bacteroidota bacterium]|jgi:hypothetical protein
MKSKIFFWASILSGLSLLLCCKSGSDGQFDPGLVNNPASAEGGTSGALPVMSFSEETHDFGEIHQGEKVTHRFAFTNIGKADLIIGNARGSCGCTVPDYPKKPIAPGEKSEIEVSFNSSGKHGLQTKTISIVTNCKPSTKIITIKANVLIE